MTFPVNSWTGRIAESTTSITRELFSVTIADATRKPEPRIAT